MNKFLGIDSWTEPKLLVDSSFWINGSGFLTPTPLIQGSRFKLFGGVRDKNGKSAITHVEYDMENLDLIFRSSEYNLDTRGSRDFDSNGAILGTINRFENIVQMIYVGFGHSDYGKFIAHSGLAISEDNGMTFRRMGKIMTNYQDFFTTNQFVLACHWADLDEVGSGDAMIAVGDSWEIINGKEFPRYKSYVIKMEHFEISSIQEQISSPPEVYRFGRPRILRSHLAIERLVATGGKPDGDYRPYVLNNTKPRYSTESEQFPLLPGMRDYCKKQVSYPVSVNTEKKTYVFFNCDDMGKAGSYVIESN